MIAPTRLPITASSRTSTGPVRSRTIVVGGIDQEDHDEHEDRHDAGQQRRRPVRREIGLDGVGAVDERGRRPRRSVPGRVRRPELEEPPRQVAAQSGGAIRAVLRGDVAGAAEPRRGRPPARRARPAAGRPRPGPGPRGDPPSTTIARRGRSDRCDRCPDPGHDRQPEPAGRPIERQQARLARGPPAVDWLNPGRGSARVSSCASRPWSCRGRSSTRRRCTPGRTGSRSRR